MYRPSSPRSNIYGTNPQFTLLNKVSPMIPMYDQDLYALRRRDPSIVSTLARFSRVTCYHDGEQREKQGLEGRMLLYEREIYPVYGFCVLNDQGSIDHIQHLYPEDDISLHSNRLKVQSYPDFTRRRLSLARSSSTEILPKFSDVYVIPNLDSLSRSKGTPKTVELSAVAEDMIGVLVRLYSYIKNNKPYPNELISGPNRLLTSKYLPYTISTSTSTSTPTSTSPSPSTSYSPCPSPSLSFLSPSAFSSPPNSQSSSPVPTSSSHFLRPNKDYYRRALLNHLLFPTPGSTPAGSFVPASTRGPPTSTCDQAPNAIPKAITGCSFVGGSGAESRNFPDSVPRANANTSQRQSSSGLAHLTDSSVTTVSSEAVASTNRLPSPETNEDTTFPDLSSKIGETDKYSFARGSFSDIYRGELRTCRDAKACVAIKIIRIPGFMDDDADIVKTINERLYRESIVWNTLDHPNILPFLGICRDFGPFPALISPYFPFRDVVYYLKRNPAVDRWRILTGFTNGLTHLHFRGVIHGDLKGTNVLINEDGEPCICDFGVSEIINCQAFTTGFIGTGPLMAPELLPDSDEEYLDNDVENPPFRPMVTKETDIYAYGLVALQILTGKDPIARRFVARKTQVWPKRKRYDPNLTMRNQLWGLFESCCDLDPKARPTMVEVMECIRSMGRHHRSSESFPKPDSRLL